MEGNSCGGATAQMHGEGGGDGEGRRAEAWRVAGPARLYVERGVEQRISAAVAAEEGGLRLRVSFGGAPPPLSGRACQWGEWTLTGTDRWQQLMPQLALSDSATCQGL